MIPALTEGLIYPSAGRLDIMSSTEVQVNAPIPEPATLLLVGTGLIGLTGFRRKRTAA